MSISLSTTEYSGRILWVVALQIEAKPLIQRFNLRRDMDEHHWPVYGNGSHRLIISGVGQLNAAMAVTWLLAREDEMPAALINVGLCGSNHPDLPQGTLLQASSITDAASRRMFLPDLYTDWPLPRHPLTCFDQVVDGRSQVSDEPLTCDMESAGIMTAGRRFLQTHQVHLFKVVSDRLDPRSVDRDRISHWLDDAVCRIADFLPDIMSLAGQADSDDTRETEAILAMAETKLQPSGSMRRQIQQEVRLALLRGLSQEYIISQLPSVPVTSRYQGKQELQRWRDALATAAAEQKQHQVQSGQNGRTGSGRTI
ncbi:MAG: hypothetical protein EOM13_08245 [Clostridia bacterium]|nr:hypothetical protein [Clostridia bacterium]